MLTYEPSIYERWQVLKTPVGSLLPGIVDGSVGQNEVAEWLTAPIDRELIQIFDELLDYARIFDPAFTEDKWLDFLSLPCGFAGGYWDTKWTVPQKRWMLANSIQYIWPNRGTQECLQRILDNFDLNAEIWTDGRLQFPVPFGSKFGRPRMRFYVLMPNGVSRTSYEWNLAKQLTRQYSLAGVKKRVVNKVFKMGSGPTYSKFGDPLFKVNRQIYITKPEDFQPTTPLEQQTGGIPLTNQNGRIYNK